jgi:hypothetical protein
MLKQKTLRVAVGIPSMGMWYEGFAMSMMHVALAFNTYDVKGYTRNELRVISTKGSILAKSRWNIVQEARKMEADYLLFVDCDHTFPRNMLHRLLAHKKDVVACNLVTKQLPACPTARAAPVEGGAAYGEIVYSDPDKHGLEKVWRIGTGIMLIKMSVFDRVPAGHLFDVCYRADVDNYQGEDWSMAEAFERAGVEMFIDHDLSRECGHIGFFNYTHDFVGSVVED